MSRTIPFTWSGVPVGIDDYQRFEDACCFGWYLISAASGLWTRASATTINVPSGAASLYQIGDKLRYKQGGGWKYAYIIAVADTLLTVTGGVDYNIAAGDITDIYVSRAENPVGFPGRFLLSDPVWTTTGTAFTNQPPAATSAHYFTIQGRICSVFGGAVTHATSGGTGLFIASFTAGELPAPDTNSTSRCGAANASSTFGNAFLWGNDIIRIGKYDATAIAGSGTGFQYHVDYLI
jgi:hypothetical protein